MAMIFDDVEIEGSVTGTDTLFIWLFKGKHIVSVITVFPGDDTIMFDGKLKKIVGGTND